MDMEFLSGLGLSDEQSASVMAAHEEYVLGERLKSELAAAGVRDEAAADALLEREGMNSENLSQRIADLKQAHPCLFRDTSKPRIVSNARSDSSVKKSDFAKMGYAQRLKLYSADPELYNRLV